MTLIFLYCIQFIAIPDSLLGHESKTLREIYELYCDYGWNHGFSVRKYTTKWMDDRKTIRRQNYACSFHGFTKEDGKKKRKRKTKTPRTGCQASIQVKLNKESDMYVITRHIVVQNHEIVKLQHVHFLRSQ